MDIDEWRKSQDYEKWLTSTCDLILSGGSALGCLSDIADEDLRFPYGLDLKYLVCSYIHDEHGFRPARVLPLILAVILDECVPNNHMSRVTLAASYFLDDFRKFVTSRVAEYDLRVFRKRYAAKGGSAHEEN